MIFLALSLLVAVQTHALPQSDPDVTIAAPATAPQGALEPPSVPPRTALGASSVPPEPPDDGDPYAETTRMTRIARGILGTVTIGSVVAVLVHSCAG
ncbi:MAG TPA: hypothetical protein VFA43_18800 [Gemmatimonadaceae bacterium]|nr:hypothetical protein [Gemmatimonadaceae bacterium]